MPDGAILLGVIVAVLLLAAAVFVANLIARGYQSSIPVSASDAGGPQTCDEARARLKEVDGAIESAKTQLAKRRDDLGPWQIALSTIIGLLALGGLGAIGAAAGGAIPAAVVLLIAAGLLVAALLFVQSIISAITADIETIKNNLHELEKQKTEAQANVERLCVAMPIPPVASDVVDPG
jgi:uncharacterized protein YpuA (DUF1002 family)